MTRDMKRRFLYAGMFAVAGAVATILHVNGMKGALVPASMYVGAAAMLIAWPLIWGKGAKLTAKEPKHPAIVVILVGLLIILLGTGIVAVSRIPGQSDSLNTLIVALWGSGSAAYLIFRSEPDPAARTDEREIMMRRRSDLIGADASFWLIVAICAAAVVVSGLNRKPDFVIEAKWIPSVLLGLLAFRIAVMAVAKMVIRRREGAHGGE